MSKEKIWPPNKCPYRGFGLQVLSGKCRHSKFSKKALKVDDFPDCRVLEENNPSWCPQYEEKGVKNG